MKKLLVLTILTAMVATSGVRAQDARAVIAAASKAMGADALRSVEYSASSGSMNAVGQAPGPGKPWPRFTIIKYNAAINFEAPAMREELVRIDDENPPRGGGAGGYVPATGQGGIRPIPFGPQTQIAMRDARNEVGLLQIWLTPHGFLKAAAAGNPTLRTTTVRGRPSHAVSFTALGKYPITGTINDQNLVERVETRVPNALLGDMVLEAVYSDYRDAGGVKFPMRSSQRQGGFPTLDLTIADVRPEQRGRVAADRSAGRRCPGGAAERRSEGDRSRRVIPGSRAGEHPGRVQRPRRRGRGAGQRRADPGVTRRDQARRPEEADPLPGEHASPFGSFRRAARVCGGRRHRDHPRAEQAVLREDPEEPLHAEPRSPGARPAPRGHRGRDGQAGADRRHPNAGDPSRAREPSRRSAADGLPAEGEVPDPGRRVRAAAAGGEAAAIESSTLSTCWRTFSG